MRTGYTLGFTRRCTSSWKKQPSQNPKPETREPKPETSLPKLETRDQVRTIEGSTTIGGMLTDITATFKTEIVFVRSDKITLSGLVGVALLPSASKRRGNNLNYFEDFCLNAEAIIWS